MIRIMTVMDNLKGEQDSLYAEPALSFYITIHNEPKIYDMRLMFDFGAGKTALKNARLLNVPLKKIDFAISSHGHYDHGNGYPFFVEAGMNCPLVTGRGYFNEKYELCGESAAYIGLNFDATWLEENKIEHRECDSLLGLFYHLWVVGPMKRSSRHDFEMIPKKFVIRDYENNTWAQDMFTDEIALVMDTAQGLILIVGCSHPGILNIIETVQEQLHRPIRAIVGGTHLRSANDDRLERTISELSELRKEGLSLVAFSHCSGPRVRELMEAAGLPSVTLRVGDCLFF